MSHVGAPVLVATHPNALIVAPAFQDPGLVKQCGSCKTSFGFLSTKRHCRRCGMVCCDPCTQTRIPLPPLHPRPVSVCRGCWTILSGANVSPSVAAAAVSSAPAAPPSAAAFSENLFVLSSLFPGLEAEVVREILNAQQGNLARAIQFLQASGSEASELPKGGVVAMMPNAAAGGASATPHMSIPPSPSSIPPLHAVSPDRSLTPLQKRFFYDHGFLHLSQVIPLPMVQMALGQINESLGRGINKEDYHRDAGGKSTHVKYCPDASSHPAIVSLFRDTPVAKLCESLLGVGQFNLPGGAQVALTFPNAHATGGRALANPAAASAQLAKHWHIDGVHRKKNGFAEDEIRNFTLLVGVYLSEAPSDWHGNITVFPGSHKELEAYFRQVDPLIRLVDDKLPQIHLNQPHQLHVRPGDVLLSHYSTAHTVASNYSPSIRYALYFRLVHTSRPRSSYSPECFTHIWTEFAGMRDIHLEVEAQAAERARQEQAARDRQTRAAQEEADRLQAIELQRQWNEQPPPQQQQPHSHQPQPRPPQPAPDAVPYATPIAPPMQFMSQPQYPMHPQYAVGTPAAAYPGTYAAPRQPQQQHQYQQQQQQYRPAAASSSSAYPGVGQRLSQPPSQAQQYQSQSQQPYQPPKYIQ